MKTPSIGTKRHGQIRALTIRHLEKLTPDDLKALTRFANRRLGSLPQSPFSADDAVQKALLSILFGTVDSGQGRRPKLEHVHDKNAFLHYVRSAINSVIEGHSRTRELLYIHESIHESETEERSRTLIMLTSAPDADADPRLIDLKNELFKRLRESASGELLPVIVEWEKTFFWANHVPCRRKRDHVRQVRVLAMRILKELAEDVRC